MFFDIALLNSYNHLFADRLIANCKCYERYRTDFDRTMIHERQSYLACLFYKSTKRNRISHRSVPILLGSYLDYVIRGRAAVLETWQFNGAAILKGVLKTYHNFNTFHSMSIHVRQSKNEKTVEWFMYVKDDEENGAETAGRTAGRAGKSKSRRTVERDAAAVALVEDDDDADDGDDYGKTGLALSYRDKCVYWTYKGKNYCSRDSDEWVSLIARANRLESSRAVRGRPTLENTVLGAEYMAMFDTILREDHDMNDLQNRQIKNAPNIILRYIEHDLANRRKKQGAGCVKMGEAFENGTIYCALSKRNLNDHDNWNKNYTQDYNNTTHEGRSGRIRYSLNEIKRASNDAVRNSNALTFPKDGLGYICPLANRDLKSVGEQTAFADMTITSESTDRRKVAAYLRELHEPNGRHMLTVDGVILNVTCDWTLEKLIAAKKRFGHLTTMYYMDRVVVFVTRDSIPIKYSDRYDVFFSPAETRRFGIEYPESDMISSTAKLLGIENIRRTPPAKITVSVNNVKGSVANVSNDLHLKLMRNSLGTTCYIKRVTELKTVSRGHDTSHFDAWYAKLSRYFGLDAAQRPIERTSRKRALTELHRLYPGERLLTQVLKDHERSTIGVVYNASSRGQVEEYQRMLYSKDNYDPETPFNIVIYCVLGNPHGSCIEDGFVLDSSLVESLPPIHYNACITVEVSYATNKMPRQARFYKADLSSRRREDGDKFIGYIVSPHEAYIKNSKHTIVETSKIGNHYYHLIHFLPNYTELEVSMITAGNTNTVVIKGTISVRVGKGSKLANAYGQKNVVSDVIDLSDLCWGVKRNGDRVHAQGVYNYVSLISRQPAGQLYDMLTSPDLAIGPNGEIIAPINLVVHTLHPYTNDKVFDIKVDTLTHMNGFDSQCLPNVSRYLRQSSVRDKVLQVFGFLGNEIEFLQPDPREARACGRKRRSEAASTSEERAKKTLKIM